MDLISEIQKFQKELIRSKEKFDQAQDLYDNSHTSPRKNFQFARGIDYSSTKSINFVSAMEIEMPSVSSLDVEDFKVKRITYDIESDIYESIRAERAIIVPWMQNHYETKRMLSSIRSIYYSIPEIYKSVSSIGLIEYVRNKDGGTRVDLKEMIERLELPGFSDNILDWTPEQLLMLKMAM